MIAIYRADYSSSSEEDSHFMYEMNSAIPHLSHPVAYGAALAHVVNVSNGVNPRLIETIRSLVT